MGRTLLADERIQGQVDQLCKKGKCLVGLIVGQLTPQKDHVVHLAPTPPPEEGAEGQDKGLEAIDDHWVSTHSKQVLRMLPGGIDIIGVYAVAPNAVLDKSQNHLRQILFAINKSMKKSQIYKEDDVTSDRYLVQICSLSKKITTRTFDISDVRSSAKPADWKTQSSADTFTCLSTSVSVDEIITVSMDTMSKSLIKQLQAGLSGLCDNIHNSIVAINNQLLDEDAPVVDQGKSQGKKSKKQKDQAPAQELDVTLFQQMGSRKESQEPVISKCGARLLIQGLLSCRAYVHSKASVGEASRALKTDIMRSILCRCELVCEDLLQAEEEQDIRVLYESPLRVFAPLPDTSLAFCDYTFPDETPKESVDRFKEFLDLDLEEALIDTSLERLPDTKDVSRPELKTDSSVMENLSDIDQGPAKESGNIIGMAMGGAVALLAAAMSYVYLGGE